MPPHPAAATTEKTTRDQSSATRRSRSPPPPATADCRFVYERPPAVGHGPRERSAAACTHLQKRTSSPAIIAHAPRHSPKCHSEQSRGIPVLNCHPERSAAESKDLHFDTANRATASQASNLTGA